MSNSKSLKIRRCIVCSNTNRTATDVSYFRIPLDQDYAEKWFINLRRTDLLDDLSLHTSSFICSDHFPPDRMFLCKANDQYLKRLKRGALPYKITEDGQVEDPTSEKSDDDNDESFDCSIADMIRQKMYTADDTGGLDTTTNGYADNETSTNDVDEGNKSLANIEKAFTMRRKKPYSKKCAIFGCKGRAPLQRVFKFPSNQQLALKWRKACGYSPYENMSSKRVCEKHFPREMLLYRYLPKSTVPTLKLPDVPAGADNDDNECKEESAEEEAKDELVDDDTSCSTPITDYKLDLFEDVEATEIEIYKTFVTSVRKLLVRKSHCTTCNIHIGTAPINEAIIKMHPLLRVTLCKKCFTFYNTGGFESGEDGSELYCRWCGQGGELYCCSNCPYVFCHNCISMNFPKKMVSHIQNVDYWKCFVCNPTSIMKLRADHWALLNFIEQQKLDILNVSTDEIEINHRMSKDVSQCCTEWAKRMVITRKRDNTADIPASQPKKKAIETNESIEIDEDDMPLSVLLDETGSKNRGGQADIPEPEPNIQEPELLETQTQELDREDDVVRPHEPTVILSEPAPVLPRPVATVRPTGSAENNKTSPPKILNNLLAKKADAKNQNQGSSMGRPPLRLLPTPTSMPSLVPSGLVLTPTSVSNIGTPRQPNPVYHTVNGFCIDLNSAAQQDMYRLPNGKIIQVRRQPAAQQPQTSTEQPQVQQQQRPQLQMLQPAAFQNSQFIGSFQQLQPIGPAILQQLVPQQNQVNVVNKIPPLTLRPLTGGNLTVEGSHVQLGQHVSNMVQVYQHMNSKIKTFTNCTAYKSVNSLTDVKDLTMHLTYMLNYSISRLQTIRKECANNMKVIETEISKQNKIDGDECEIVETNKAPIINLDSDDEGDMNPWTSATVTSNNTADQFVDATPPSQPLLPPPPPPPPVPTVVPHQPPIPHFTIRTKTVPPMRPRPSASNQQNMLTKYTRVADKVQGSSNNIIIRKIKTEPKSYTATKPGTKLVKLYK